MAKKKNDKALLAAIIFGSVVISASLTFFGIQLAGGMGGDKLDVKIQEGIQAYVDAQGQAQQRPTVNSEDFTDDDPILGDKDAPITIVEFSDYECPFCKKFFDETFSLLKENYIDTGKVKLVYRDFPLSFHPKAFPAALAGECAREQGGDSTYFKLHDFIFENQDNLASDIASAQDYYADVVKPMGVKDLEQFKSCIADQKYKAEINADLEAGQLAGVSGTPGFLIGDQMVEGAQPYEAFVQVIEAQLAN